MRVEHAAHHPVGDGGFRRHRAGERQVQDVAFEHGLDGHTALEFLYAQDTRGGLGYLVAFFGQERFDLIGMDTCDLSGHIWVGHSFRTTTRPREKFIAGEGRLVALEFHDQYSRWRGREALLSDAMWRRGLLFGQTKPIDCKWLGIISIEAVFGAGFGGIWVVFGLSKTLGRGV